MISSYISVIRNTNFRRLWLSQITSQIALNMLYFVLALAVYSKTRSNTAVSTMLLSFGIPAIIFGIVAGSVVDHFDKRKILLLCNGARAILFAGFFIWGDNLILLYVLSLLMSVVTQLFIPAEVPSIPFLLSRESLLSANSLFFVSFSLSTVLGFVIAGPMVRLFGEQGVYGMMGILMLISTYYVWRLPSIRTKYLPTTGLRVKDLAKTMRDALRFITKNTRVRQSLLLMTFSQALIATLSVLAPGFADRVLTIDLTDASFLVMGPAAAGLVLGALIVGGTGKHWRKGTMILSGVLATSICLLLLSLFTSIESRGMLVNYWGQEAAFFYTIVTAFVLLVLLGGFNSLINVPASTILQEDAGDDMRGRIYGVLTSLTGGVSLLPVVASGILADTVGVSKTLLSLGVVVGVGGLYHYWKRRN